MSGLRFTLYFLGFLALVFWVGHETNFSLGDGPLGDGPAFVLLIILFAGYWTIVNAIEKGL